jgi:glycerol-3-phosphate dehydrogenase (NAD(P)+)
MIGIMGAGAFGTALGVALAQAGRDVLLWGRDTTELQNGHARHLPQVLLPDALQITADAGQLRAAQVILIAVPMQALGRVMQDQSHAFAGQALIACCKGIDLTTLTGPSAVIAAHQPKSAIGVLTGPSFATDIANGLPTALTLATVAQNAADLQQLLSTKTLRLYHSTDVIGAELGGALKNVIAISAGIVMGAGLGASARAALMTRGFVEMQRMAAALGAQGDTLAGLSGFGDLVLTCCSQESRNFRFGYALGAGKPFDPAITVEGVATAKAVSNIAKRDDIEMPITDMVAALLADEIDLNSAIAALMSRPLKKE